MSWVELKVQSVVVFTLYEHWHGATRLDFLSPSCRLPWYQPQHIEMGMAKTTYKTSWSVICFFPPSRICFCCCLLS